MTIYLNNRFKRSSMPKPDIILKYWNSNNNYERLGKLPSGYFSMVEKGCCFACGNITLLHRAHIIPLAQCSDNKAENLHLLCPGCHNESESHPAYWTWLHYKRCNHWKSKDYYIVERLKSAGINIDQEIERHESFGTNWEKRESHIKELLSIAGILIENN